MKAIAVFLIIFGILLAWVPSYYTCSAEGKMIQIPGGRSVPMKCLWTARAEMALGAILVLAGFLLLGSRGPESRRFLSLLTFSLGAFIILFPTALIGVCSNPEMSCAAIMKPMILLAGTLVCALSLMAVFSATRR